MENKIYTRCLRCGRKLKNEEARKIGYGKVCLEKARQSGKIKELISVNGAK